MEWFIQNPEAIEIMGLKSDELCINKFDVAIINSKMMNVMNLGCILLQMTAFN